MLEGWRHRFHFSGAAGEPSLELQTEEHPTGLLVRVSGEVDLANAQRIRDVIGPALRHRRSVILDATHLRYVDLAGLRVLLEVSAQLQRSGCHLVLVAVPSTVRKVMGIVGMDKLVPIVASVEEATTALNVGGSPNG